MATEFFDPRGGEAGRAERERIAALWDDTAKWTVNRRRLSDRVWLARQTVRQAIDDAIREAIARGEDPLVLADALERYLRPEQRPRRGPDGRPLPGQPRRIVTATPNPPGFRALLDGRRPFKGSYPARRLARTEITRAYGQATILAAQRNPFVRGVRWMLSGAHKDADACDDNAHRDVGLGPGVYPPHDVPAYPNHPHERCTLAPTTVDDADAVVDELRRAYRLDEGDAPGSAPPPAGERVRLLNELIAGWRWLREAVA